MHTPWGVAQTKEEIVEGMVSVSTSSHGGIHLDKKLNARVPEYMRRDDGWYEEDLDWAIVATVFPEAFAEEQRVHARQTLKDWRPDSYERFYKVTLGPGESRLRDEEIWYAQHKNDWISFSAVGDWHEGVPKGFVLLEAAKGGIRKGGELRAEFLVPAHEYAERGRFGFVVDPGRHERVKGG